MELAGEMYTVILVEIRRNVVRHKPMVKKRYAVWADVVVDIGTARANLEQRSMMTKMY